MTDERLKALMKDYQVRGSPAILDRCYDRTFCETYGLDYTERYIYSRIEHLLLGFMAEMGEVFV